MNADLAALFALQQIDTELALATRQYQSLDSGRAEQAAAETARTLFDRLSRTHSETAADLKDAELELQGIESRQKEEEKRLYSGRVQNPKELQAITEEIASMGRHRALLDEKILTLMDQVESQRAEEAEARSRLEGAEAALAAKQADWKTAARALARRIQEATARRNEQAAGIPPALLKRYDAIRTTRGGIGIGKIEDGRCGACHTNLPSNLIRRVLETGSVELCENCSRLLYGES